MKIMKQFNRTLRTIIERTESRLTAPLVTEHNERLLHTKFASPEILQFTQRIHAGMTAL